MSIDWLPRPDTEFTPWFKTFTDYAGTNQAALGLTATEVTAVLSARTTWETDFQANLAAQNAAQSARQTKDASRTAAENLLRPLVQRLQSVETVQDSDRDGLGITVRETTRTASPVPETLPLATVDTSKRLRHVISFADESMPNSRAKPEGVSGCEIWVKIGGPPPLDSSECQYLATDTRTPYTAEYAGTDGGKVAHYMLRWVNTRGERGPWSQTVSATITG